MDLEKLLDSCRAGDELAWETLVRRFQGRVFGLAFHYLGNRDEARDLAQEVFLRIYRSLDSCTDSAAFVSWVVKIARNAAIDRLRRAKARPAVSPLPIEDMTDLRADGLDPAERWRLTSRKELLHAALQSLSAVSREIILLKEIQGLTCEEIASLLEIPVGTVKSRSSRARIELARAVVARSRATHPIGSEP